VFWFLFSNEFFVACGSGSIDPYSVDDQVASISVTLDKDKSISACLADPVCKADYEAAENPPSSAVISCIIIFFYTCRSRFIFWWFGTYSLESVIPPFPNIS
jgi:hypothetical protein